MHIVICGGGGFIGQRLARLLLEKDHEVTILDRNPSRVSSPKLQSFIADLLTPDLFEERWFSGADAVVNLSGRDILTLWTEEYKKSIRESRVTVNRNLIDFMSSLDHKPKTFISASATGYDGDKGEDSVDETATSGKSFLADVCVAWEHEARRAEALGMRSVQVRTAPVLDRKGGFLGKLMKSMKFGFAVQFGSGQSWFPWIHMEDLIRVYETVLSQESLSGVGRLGGEAVAVFVARRDARDVDEERGELPAPPFVAADGERAERVAVVALPAGDEQCPLRLSDLD